MLLFPTLPPYHFDQRKPYYISYTIIHISPLFHDNKTFILYGIQSLFTQTNYHKLNNKKGEISMLPIKLFIISLFCPKL